MNRATKLRPSQGGKMHAPVQPVVHAAKQCDCDDPECQLPMGRCYLCGNPCDKTRDDHIEFTVCAKCLPSVEELHKTDDNPSEMACDDTCCGWAPFNERNGVVEIQRCDMCDRFSGDDDAAEHVAMMLGIKPTYPDGA